MAQDDCKNKYTKEALKALSLEELSGEFKELRYINGVCSKKWGSDLHLVMQALTGRLRKERMGKEEVIKWMGPPDDEVEARKIIRVTTKESILVYHWRGWHDWFYFIIEEKQVKEAEWWFAHE